MGISFKESQGDSNNKEVQEGVSLLDDILNTQTNDDQKEESVDQSKKENEKLAWTWTQKVQVQQKSWADIARIFWAIFVAWLILFSIFLAYIVFNPQQAQFFISLGINPQDIKSLLSRLVNSIFWLFTLFLTVATIIALFSAIVTKKEFSKKKTIAIILSIFLIIVLLWEITVWAFLSQKIWATDFVNPNWWVIIRDNDKKRSDKFKDGWDIMYNFDNLIWPVSLQFDLSSDAIYVSRYIRISWYDIDFDWDWKVDRKWVNPSNDQWIIFTFNKKGTYTPKWTYYWKDLVSWKDKVIDMKFPSITIVWIAIVTEKDERMWWRRVIIDISDLKQLWKMDFYLENKDGNFDVPDSSYEWWDRYSPSKIFKWESYICLVISNNIKSSNNCDKIFAVSEDAKKWLNANINAEVDPANNMSYKFTVDLKDWWASILSYEWIIDSMNVVSNNEYAEFNFADYWKHSVVLNLKTAEWNFSVTKDINISRPLSLVKPANTTNVRIVPNSLLRITDNSGKSYIEDSYSKELQAYAIKVNIPIKLNFNANFVKVSDKLYDLSKVEWDFDEDWKFEKTANSLQYEFLEDRKYEVKVKYTFTSNLKKNTQTMEEKIIIEAKKKNISAVLTYAQDSDYAPATVKFDASASQAREKEITKYAYDFWEWKWIVEWDAKQNYRYNFPWEYIVTLTVTRSDGLTDSIKKKIILKEAWKQLQINASVSSWLVWKNIDFDAVWSNWQITSYAWDFWDWQTSTDPSTSHSYSNPWTYTVKLIVTYADWVVKNWDKEITVN